MYVMIAVVLNNSIERGFRIYNSDSGEFRDVNEEYLRDYIDTGKINVVNLGIGMNNELVGTQGSIKRYAEVGTLALAQYNYPIVIINKTSNGYNVVDCMGHAAEMTEESVIGYDRHGGLANAKVVKKGATVFISAISGTFEVAGGRLSDELISQWDRLQALKVDGKLSNRAVAELDGLEEEFNSRITKLKKSEARNGLNSAYDIARNYNIIGKLADALDEIDVERVDKMQKRVSKLFKEVKALGRVQKKTMSKDDRDKFVCAIKMISKEFKNVIRLFEEESISSDECVRKFEVIGCRLSKLKTSLDK